MAATTSRMLQTALPGNPEISAVGLALQRPTSAGDEWRENLKGQKRIWLEGAPSHEEYIRAAANFGACRKGDVVLDENGEINQASRDLLGWTRVYIERYHAMSPLERKTAQSEVLSILDRKPGFCSELQWAEFEYRLGMFAVLSLARIEELKASRTPEGDAEIVRRQSDLRKIGELKRDGVGAPRIELNPVLRELTSEAYLAEAGSAGEHWRPNYHIMGGVQQKLGLSYEWYSDFIREERAAEREALLKKHAAPLNLSPEWIASRSGESTSLIRHACSGIRNAAAIRSDLAMACGQSGMAEMNRAVAELFDVPGQEPIQKVIEASLRDPQGDANEFMMRVFGAKCRDRKVEVPSDLIVTTLRRDEKNPQWDWVQDEGFAGTAFRGPRALIREALGKKLAAGVEVCSEALKLPGIKSVEDKECRESIATHALNLIGSRSVKRSDGEGCETEYLMLNSWGADCDHLKPELKAKCDPKDGKFWLGERELSRMMHSLYILRRAGNR